MRKHSMLVFLVLMSHLSFLLAQVREEWVARYRGPRNGSGSATALAVDTAGQVYVTGGSLGKGPGQDYATVKYDPNGKQVWAARYSDPANFQNVATAIAVDTAGQVYVTGYSYGLGTAFDFATIKYDADGKEVWVARYDGPGHGNDGGRAIALDEAGNVYVTGESDAVGTGREYATIKYNAQGEPVWVARYHGPGNGQDGATAIAVDSDGNIYVTGASTGMGTDLDYATIKYDAHGKQLWVARYNGPGNGVDFARAIALDTDGHVYVTGGSVGMGTSLDYATVKYDAQGNQVWVTRYNGPGNLFDSATALAVDTQGNVYVTGSSWGIDTREDYATIKYDSGGKEVWVARYNGPGNSADFATALAIDAEANVYVTGSSTGIDTQYDYATIKYDTDGNQIWAVRYNGPTNGNDEATALAIDSEANIYVTGSSPELGTIANYVTIKYSQK